MVKACRVEWGVTFAEFTLDGASGHLYRGDVVVPLTPKAFAVLQYLVSHAGRLVGKQELLDAVWPGVFVGDAVLKVAIREIRRALGDNSQAPRFIETAHRRGYRFMEPVVPATSNPWAKTPVDRFILAKLEAKKLAPSADEVNHLRPSIT